MSGNRDETVQQFCDVTGADEARSKFFLESANWQLEEAISSFFEHGGNAEENVPAPTAVAASLPTLSDSDKDSTPPDSPQRPKKGRKKQDTNFATLDSLQQDDSSSDSEEAVQCFEKRMDEFCCSHNIEDAGYTINRKALSKEEIEKLKNEIKVLSDENSQLKDEVARLKLIMQEDKGEAFYAGGSERSGQQILGPGKARKDIVTEVFKSVKERGAVVFEDEPSTTSRGRGGVFGGVGYRLGQTADDHEPVNQATGATASGNEPRSVRLRLYREGFTVDAGELRAYGDRQHAEFLNYIRRGEVPPELGGGEVRVSLEDRRHEPAPARPRAAFTGHGHLLGSPTPPTVGATAPVTAVEDEEANRRAAQEQLNVDDTQPTTNVQFRLADGSRLTGRFNHSHTIEDLVRFVSQAVPRYQLTPFTLLNSYPSRELTDSTATLVSANLLNSTLLQRLNYKQPKRSAPPKE